MRFKLQKRFKLVEILIGLSMPLFALTLSMILKEGLIDGFSAGTFLYVFLAVSPIAPAEASWSLLLIPTFGVTFYFICKFVEGPYLRFVVALHFSAWMFFGLNTTILFY